MGKLNKKVAIARSGVYVYSAEALPGLGLSQPPEKKGKGTFGVYRPATVLAKAKDKFTRLPVTLEHPPVLINGNNFRDFAQGFTGDTASIEFLKDMNEITINSSLTLMDNEAVNAYYRGIVEVSPGYIGVFDWEDGVSPNGDPYDIVMRDIQEVNHLALTRAGRGGSAACILDSREVGMKGRKSGLFYSIYKMMKGVTDSGEGSFTEKMSALISDRLRLSSEEMEKRVDELRTIVDYLPDSDDKFKLVRYVDDLSRIGEETDESAKKIGIIVGNLFYTLDTAASKDAVVDAAEKPHEETSEEEAKETPEHEASESPAEEKAEHDVGEEAAVEEAKPAEEAVAEPEKIIPKEDLAIGLDDSIFDKKQNELTTEECDYIHGKLMEMLKEHLRSKITEPVIPTGKETAEPASEETADTTSEEPMAEPEEKKDEAVEEKAPEEKKTEDSVHSEPQYPVDGLVNDGLNVDNDKGLDIDTFFKDKMKGGR